MNDDMEKVVDAFIADDVDFVFGCTRLDSCISYVQTSKSKGLNVRAASLSACVDSQTFRDTLGSDSSYFAGPQIWIESSVST